MKCGIKLRYLISINIDADADVRLFDYNKITIKTVWKRRCEHPFLGEKKLSDNLDTVLFSC